MKPLQIGTVSLFSPLILAPMAGHTHHAFRSLVHSLGGCGLVCSEMISSKALRQKGSRLRTLSIMDWKSWEKPLSVQLFGNNPQEMAQATREIAAQEVDLIDINMGCWVPKVSKKNGGAGLLRDLGLAQEVIAAVCESTSKPVTLKLRAGWERGQNNCLEICQMANRYQVDAVTLHPRYAKEGYKAPCDRQLFAQLRGVLNPEIALIANGDIQTIQDIWELAPFCQGFMIGRQALGKPWILTHLYTQMQNQTPQPLSLLEKAQLLWKHALWTLYSLEHPPEVLLRELRGQLAHYCQQNVELKKLLPKLVKINQIDQLRRLLSDFLETTEDTFNIQRTESSYELYAQKMRTQSRPHHQPCPRP